MQFFQILSGWWAITLVDPPAFHFSLGPLLNERPIRIYLLMKHLKSQARGVHPCKAITKEDEGDGRTRSLTPDEYRRLTAVLMDDLSYLLDAMSVALGTGLRRGELLALKIQCVNLGDSPTYTMVKGQSVEVLPNCLLVPAQGRSKRKYTRTVPLSATVRAALVRLIGNRSGGDLVFTKEANGVNNYSLREGFEQACLRAEIPHGRHTLGGLIFHDLRRCFATRLRANNVHPYDISFCWATRFKA